MGNKGSKSKRPLNELPPQTRPGQRQENPSSAAEKAPAQAPITLFSLAATQPFTIKISTLTKTVTLDVKRADTIASLKSQIERRENIRPDQQRLLFAGKELQNNQTLQECKITPGSTVNLVFRLANTKQTQDGNGQTTTEPEKITQDRGSEETKTPDGTLNTPEPKLQTINVKRVDGSQFEFQMNQSATIWNLKKKIEEITGIPSQLQRLTLQDQEMVEDFMVQDYKAEKTTSLLQLKLRDLNMIELHIVRPFGERKDLAFEAYGMTRISELKTKIHSFHGVNPEEERIILNGQTLEDDQTLFDYKLKPEAQNYVTLHLMKAQSTKPETFIWITLKTVVSQNSITVKVSTADPFLEVHKLVEEKWGYTVCAQQFLAKGKRVEKWATPADYDLPDQAELFVILKMRGC